MLTMKKNGREEEEDEKGRRRREEKEQEEGEGEEEEEEEKEEEARRRGRGTGGKVEKEQAINIQGNSEKFKTVVEHKRCCFCSTLALKCGFVSSYLFPKMICAYSMPKGMNQVI